MRKRYPVAIGGGIAVLFAMQYFDFGLGFQSGDGSVVSVQTPTSSTESTSLANPTETTSVESSTKLDRTLPDVVDVLIDENLYLVIRDANAPEKREPMDLDGIVAMISQVSGEESGIRVRVARTPNAIAAAEDAILTRLTEAGLDPDEIDSRRQLVE